MKYSKLIFFCLSAFICLSSSAQVDLFTGTWNIQHASTTNSPLIEMELQIAAPDKNLLYPAQLRLNCDSFHATYNLLLVKRNARQLGIGRQKVPEYEMPFSIGNWTVYLNGTFDMSRDNKGQPMLTVNRVTTGKYGADMPDIKSFAVSNIKTAETLRAFLKDAEISLRKKNHEPWQSLQADSMLHSPTYGTYYGIQDTVFVSSRECRIEFPGSKKNDNGIISVLFNGTTIIDQAYLGYKKPQEEVLLDTGLNTLVFYAENYGKTAANTGKMQISCGKNRSLLNFADKKDVGATFIVARIVYFPPKEERSENENELWKLSPEFQLQNSDNVFYYPDKMKSDAYKKLPVKQVPDSTLYRNVKLLGNIDATARQITLAIWDDAVEDGDSISLSINGKWIVQGLAVKKRPQFIIVTLEPGQNKITFVADNLGSIIPNTSVLEIIDGKKRKSFMIDTDLNQNNLVNIYYDVGLPAR